MGFEHLRELLVRLARPLLRQGANIAYGGSWEPSQNNLLLELLRQVRAEQEDTGAPSGSGADAPKIGELYNHLAWPDYLKITPSGEAEWISVCRVVRMDQIQAGVSAADLVTDADAQADTPRARFNRALALSAMRRARLTTRSMAIPDAPPERVPQLAAHVLLGGRLTRYQGFLPGTFENTLLTLKHRRPTYILGGFGGASEVLAQVILSEEKRRRPELTLGWQRKHNKALDALLKESVRFARPVQLGRPKADLEALERMLRRARTQLSATLNTGLSDAETRELMLTCNIGTAVRLVLQGLSQQFKMHRLPA